MGGESESHPFTLDTKKICAPVRDCQMLSLAVLSNFFRRNKKWNVTIMP